MLKKFVMSQSKSQPEVSNRHLPLSKISKIMKLDPDVKIVSKDSVKCVQYATVLL